LVVKSNTGDPLFERRKKIIYLFILKKKRIRIPDDEEKAIVDIPKEKWLSAVASSVFAKTSSSNLFNANSLR